MTILGHFPLFLGLKGPKKFEIQKMRYGFFAARELNVCAKFQVRTSKIVAVHTDGRVKQEKPKANQVCCEAPCRSVHSTGLWNSII